MKTKICTKCKKRKSVNNFGKHRLKLDGLQYWCKDCRKQYRQKNQEKNRLCQQKYCQKNREKIRLYQQKHQKGHPYYKREYRLKKVYNITIKQYDEMFAAQNGVCAMCGKVNICGHRLSIDHNHKTGKIRGLLCKRCNVRLGIVEDMDFMKKAIKYLKDTE